MTKNSLQQLYSDYRSLTSYSPENVIDYFSKKTLLFNSLKTFDNESDLIFYIEMVNRWLSSLYKKDRYNETVDDADKYLQIIDGEISRLNLNSIKDDWYFGIVSLKAMALYELREYKHSTPIFKRLSEQDSKNENYKIWLRYSSYGQRMWISKTVSIVCGLLFLFVIFSEKSILSPRLALFLEGFAFMGLMGTMVFEWQVKRSFRKTK